MHILFEVFSLSPFFSPYDFLVAFLLPVQSVCFSSLAVLHV